MARKPAFTNARKWKAAEDLMRHARIFGAQEAYAELLLEDIIVRISLGDAYVGVTIESGGFLVPWNVKSGVDKQFSPSFGLAVRAEVNPFHRRKCMGYETDFESLCDGIARALRCIAEGRAFLPPVPGEAQQNNCTEGVDTSPQGL